MEKREYYGEYETRNTAYNAVLTDYSVGVDSVCDVLSAHVDDIAERFNFANELKIHKINFQKKLQKIME